MDCSLPRSSVHGIFQARVLEWVAISFSRGSSQPRDWTWVSCIVDRHFTVWATREVMSDHATSIKKKLALLILRNHGDPIYSGRQKTESNFHFQDIQEGMCLIWQARSLMFIPGKALKLIIEWKVCVSLKKQAVLIKSEHELTKYRSY